LKKTLSVFLIGGFGLLSACASQNGADNGRTPVPIDQVSDMIADSPVIAFSGGRFQGFAEFHPDGKLDGDFGWAKDSGKWWVNENAICIQFDRAIWGQERCAQLFKASGKYFDIYEIDSAVKRGSIRFTN